MILVRVEEEKGVKWLTLEREYLSYIREKEAEIFQDLKGKREKRERQERQLNQKMRGFIVGVNYRVKYEFCRTYGCVSMHVLARMRMGVSVFVLSLIGAHFRLVFQFLS